jgi:hypothetical protein
MADDNSTRSFPMTVGLWGLIEELRLQVPQPATRSEIVAGARKTIAADGKILEQYPRNYAPKGLFGNLRLPCAMNPLHWTYTELSFRPSILANWRSGFGQSPPAFSCAVLGTCTSF